VERCDACERFPNDLSAAASLYGEVKWIQCASGGWHAVGRRFASLAVARSDLDTMEDVEALGSGSRRFQLALN